MLVRKESKPPVLLKPKITKSVHTDSKMSDNALDKYLLPNYNEEDDDTLSGVLPLPKTPDYRPVQDDYDLMVHSEFDDQDEASPPPSQPRRIRVERAEHPIPPRKPEKSEKKENNPPERKREEKRGSKRKYVDQRSVEAKISKTEESIHKLQRHLNNRTCPKSLQYSARANITPDGDFQKEVRDTKHNAEQAFVNALSRFHKWRLENHQKKLKAGPTGLTHRNTAVHRQSRIESQSAQSIVNTTDAKIAELEKKITDLTDIVSAHVIKDNKQVEQYYFVFSEPLATNTSNNKSNCLSKKKR